MSEAKPRVGLCLNSSFLGYFAHAGFLRALTELGIRPVAVSGASAGALVSGLFAAGVAPDEMLRLFLSRTRRAAAGPGYDLQSAGSHRRSPR